MDEQNRKQNNREIEENNAWDHLSKWDSLIEDRIRKLIGDGDMSWHPKAGQPLIWDDDSFVPEDQRLANKLMKDNDAVPPWMALGFVLREKYSKIKKRTKQYARDYVKRQQDALAKGSFVMHRKAQERWDDAIKRLRKDIDNYNSDLLNYNLQVPSGVGQMIPLKADEEIEKALEQARRDSQ